MDTYQHGANPSIRDQGADPRALDVKERIEGDFLEIPEVQAVGMGEDDHGAPVIDVMADPASLPLDLPDSVDGVQVRQIPFKFADGGAAPTAEPGTLLGADRNFYTDLLGGINIGIPRPTHSISFAGTLGVVWVDLQGEPVLLSNHHVLYGTDGLGRPGDVVVQPEPNALYSAPVAVVGRGFGGVIKYKGDPVGVDCAIAVRPTRSSLPLQIQNIGKLYGEGHVVKNATVMKRGYATLFTQGKVLKTNVSIRWIHGNIVFPNQIIIRGIGGDFSAPGDSGSIVVEVQPEGLVGVGLHWGSATAGTYTGCSVSSPLKAALHVLELIPPD